MRNACALTERIDFNRIANVFLRQWSQQLPDFHYLNCSVPQGGWCKLAKISWDWNITKRLSQGDFWNLDNAHIVIDLILWLKESSTCINSCIKVMKTHIKRTKFEDVKPTEDLRRWRDFVNWSVILFVFSQTSELKTAKSWYEFIGCS